MEQQHIASTPPRIGLLACDMIWEPLRSAHGDYADMIATILRAAGAEFELVTYAAHAGELPARADECDGWIISGSRASVYEQQAWIARLMDFSRAAFAAAVPQVGICFGHQLLAHALGGRTEKAVNGWGLGNLELRLGAAARVLGTEPSQVHLLMAHQDQVVVLPPGATCLAEAAHCPHAMFSIGARVLGLQPHPEFTAAFMRDMTLENALGLDKAARDAALASYGEPLDSPRAARWIADFLKIRPAAALTPPR